MSTKAVILILAPLIFATAPFSIGEIRIGDTPARRIAKETTLAGKNVEGQCLPFARALHARFLAAGIPSKVISYNYETLPAPRAIFGEHAACAPINERGGIAGAHAVVAYEDKGRTYVMDNQSWQPKWIHDDSPDGMAQQFSGMNTLVAKARVVDNARPSNARSSNVLAGKMRAAHLFRAHAPALRPQVIVQAGSLRFRAKMHAPNLRYGFVPTRRRQPFREEDVRQHVSPAFCRNEPRPLL